MRTLLVIAAVVATTLGCRQAPQPGQGEHSTAADGPAPVEFTLTDQNNQPFDLASLRGKAVLIFFGYTMCPDACPTTLSKLSTAYARLTPDEQRRVKTVYISVDPERDTPAVMKEHLTYFGVDSVGLTGTPEAIARVATIFGAHYEKSTVPTAGGYTMTHTVSIFGLDPRGRSRSVIGYEASVDEVVGEVRALLAAS